MDDFQVCKKFCNEIVDVALGKQPVKTPSSYLALYNEIVKNGFSIFQSLVSDEVNIDTCNLEYLGEIYKPNFSTSDWKKIQLFEWHFQTYYKIKAGSSYENILKKKEEFLNLCKSSKTNAQIIHGMVGKTIERNRLRKCSTEALNGIQLQVGGINHLPEKIEVDTMNCITTYLPENTANVLCVDCTSKCNHDHGVHILVNLEKNIEIPILNDACVIIRAVLKRKHFVNTPEIIFLTNYAFRSFKESIPPRFTIRDQLKMGALSDNIYHISKSHDVEMMEPEEFIEPNLCSTCFKDFRYLNDPLDIDHFNVTNEWLMHVPLPFEAHLKTLNQAYCGIIQDIYTDELIVNYHNISTVFSLTSHAGISHSQRTGDRRLRKNADPELCYYRTFMKRYPIVYREVNQEMDNEHKISIRECHLALLMDNLVHLTMTVDPRPGQCRTNQLCTLPLTVKGIPKNAYVTSNWHLDNCDGSSFCSCMHQTQLKKADVNKVFLELTAEEQTTNNIFKENMSWGFKVFWSGLYKHANGKLLYVTKCFRV
ncbi:unnamed protein product [Mytilus coruscus]|uniref:Uncharacterized protein n=1 Tax=Mytilus coruscus TaxID=42192 RepID=A0A6J8A2F2_MYTCO|nr:unnamed protein product [Mytilus coruscus]